MNGDYKVGDTVDLFNVFGRYWGTGEITEVWSESVRVRVVEAPRGEKEKVGDSLTWPVEMVEHR